MNSNLGELLVNKGHLTGDTRWLRRNRYYTLSVLHSFFISIVADIKDTPSALNSFGFLASCIDLFYCAEEFCSRFLVQSITFIQMTNVAHKSVFSTVNLISFEKKWRDQTLWRVKDLN